MQNPKLIYTFSNGQQLYIADPDPVVSVESINLGLGPHLLIDPYLLETPGFTRVVHSPMRTRNTPILTGRGAVGPWHVADFGCSVLRDPVSGTFSIHYLTLDPVSGKLLNAVCTSSDGVAFGPPTLLPALGDNVLGVILDDGPTAAYPALRYRAMLRQLVPTAPPLWAADLWYSADALNWSKGANLVTTAYGEGYSLFRDNGGFSLLHRWNLPGYSWTDAEGVRHTNVIHDPWVRAVGFSFSPDGNAFPPSKLVFQPGPNWHGETQMYYVSNIIQRGDLRLGVMGILRDDLAVGGIPAGVVSTGGGPAYGTGYSTLVWSSDGVNWSCYDGFDPHFFDPDPSVTAWDHAMSWIVCILPVGDDVFLYYGGYQWGHKVGTDRQIGVAKIKRDRYVSRQATATTVLRTKVVTLNASNLSLNMAGTIRVQITDTNGTPIPGYSFADSAPLVGDNLNMPYPISLKSLSGTPIKIEFELTNADLYAFYLS